MEAVEKRINLGKVKASALGIGISLFSIFLIFKITGASISSTLSLLYRCNMKFIAVAFVLHFLFWILWAVRLKFLSSLIKQNIDFIYALKTTLASLFLAAITPSSAGGEPLRVKMLTRKGAAVGSASAIVLAERVLDSLFFVIALPIFLLISRFPVGFGFEAGITFTFVLFLFIAFLYSTLKKPERIRKFSILIKKFLKKFISEEKAENIRNKLENELFSFREALVELVKAPSLYMLFLIFLTSIIWISEFLVPSAILLALNEDPVVLLSLTAQLILVIVSLIPLTPGSSGIAEGGMVYLYSDFVKSYVLGVLVATWRFITYYTSLIVGFIINILIIKPSINLNRK